MKATGIVRRIDDLGRVVIPKEIRRTMRIREGDPLEIYTDRQGTVIFKKYSPMGDLADIILSLCESLNKTSGNICVICDREMIIATAGRKDLYEKNISSSLEKIISQRQIYKNENSEINIIEDTDSPLYVAAPIITNGDIAGCVMLIKGNKNLGNIESDALMAELTAGFLSKQMEH